MAWWKRRKKRQRLIVYLIITALIVLSAPTVIRKATGTLPKTAELYFLSQDVGYITGQAFPIELRVKTGDTSINAMGFRLTFDPAKLEVQRMTTDKSFCTLFTENSFDNQRGIISLACGRPTPGFTGDSVAVKITFRAKVAGNTTLSVNQESALLLANDGKGSNISKETPSITLNILQF